MTVQRYTWSDAVVDAQAAGLISNGALMVCLKLARAINWVPADGKPSGLYWKNEDAFKSVGISRTSYYDHRAELFEKGFFKMEKGNLIPVVPDLSALGTDESVVRITESAVRTDESAVRNPYSEDTYSEDVLSEDSLSEGEPVPDSPNYEYLGSLKNEDFPNLSLGVERLDYFSNSESVVAVANAVEDTPESVVRTEDYSKRTAADWRDIRKQRPLTADEQDYINDTARAYMDAKRAQEPVTVGDVW